MDLLIFLSIAIADDCYSKLAIDTNYSQEVITKLLMSCNNQMLIGENIFLTNNKNSDKLIRRHYPKHIQDDDAVVTELEKATRIITYTKCQEISANLKKYMKKCEKLK